MIVNTTPNGIFVTSAQWEATISRSTTLSDMLDVQMNTRGDFKLSTIVPFASLRNARAFLVFMDDLALTEENLADALFEVTKS